MGYIVTCLSAWRDVASKLGGFIFCLMQFSTTNECDISFWDRLWAPARPCIGQMGMDGWIHSSLFTYIILFLLSLIVKKKKT